MGIFDNVNWQQALPGALMGFAGGMDPRSSPMLAQSGWNAVKSYMEQQQMQQQQEQFQERLKLYKEEQSQRERQLKISEGLATRRNEEDLEDQYYMSRFGDILSTMEKNPDTPASQIFGMLNDPEKLPKGMKLNASRFMDMYNKSSLFKTTEGPIMFRWDGDKLELVREVTGAGGKKHFKPMTLAEGVTPDIMKAIEEDPLKLEKLGEQAEDKNEKQLARFLYDKAAEVREKQRVAMAEKGSQERIKITEHEEKAGMAAIQARHDWDPVGRVYNKDPKGALEEEAVLHESIGKQRLEILQALQYNPKYRKLRGEEAKHADEPFKGTPAEKEKYAYLLELMKKAGVPAQERVITARAALKWYEAEQDSSPERKVSKGRGAAARQQAPAAAPAAPPSMGPQIYPRGVPAPGGQVMPPQSFGEMYDTTVDFWKRAKQGFKSGLRGY